MKETVLCVHEMRAIVELYPFFGLTLRPEIGAIAMSGSSIIVAVNALLLRRLELEDGEWRADERT